MPNLLIIGSINRNKGWTPCNPPQSYTPPEERDLPARKPPQQARSQFDSECLKADIIEKARQIAGRKKMP